MKSFIKITFALALTSMLFFSCSKDDTVANTEKKVKITLSANKDGISTKTAAVEGETSASYIWTTEDAANIKLYTVSGGSLTEVQNPTVNVSSDNKVMTISAVVDPGSYTFRAILAANYTSGNPKVSATQTPNGTSNYDPNADILVSDDLDVTVDANGQTTGNMLLTFRRQVVINKMTLKNIVAGEKVSKVEISSDKDLTGYLSNGSMVGDGKTITLNYSNVTVPDGGEFPVYFVSMANSGQTVTVKVTTDKKEYTRTFGPLNIIQGQFTRIGVKLPKTVTILFGNETGDVQINGMNVSWTDSFNNNWTFSTDYSVIFSQTSEYSQIGGEYPEVPNPFEITTTSLSSATILNVSVMVAGTNNSASANVHLKVGDTDIKTDNLNNNLETPKTIESNNPDAKKGKLSILVDNIWYAGIRVYKIEVTYID